MRTLCIIISVMGIITISFGLGFRTAAYYRYWPAEDTVDLSMHSDLSKDSSLAVPIEFADTIDTRITIPIGFIDTANTRKSVIYYSSKQISNMKHCTIQFPKSKAKEVAKFLAENSIITNLSWMESGDFFSTQVTAIICFPDDKEDKVKANLQKYIKDGQ